jgi:basic membrane protein A
VIFHAAGPGSKSVIDAALKNDFYLIGVNSADNNLASENILTNVIKKISFITENETKNFYRGDFKTGTKIYDLASGGIGLDQDQAEKTLSKDVLDKLEEYKKMIIDGRIDISNKTSQ